MSPVTFAKRMKQWRSYFFENGWLNYDMRPEIIRSRKIFERKGVKKKKNKLRSASRTFSDKIKNKILVLHEYKNCSQILKQNV